MVFWIHSIIGWSLTLHNTSIPDDLCRACRRMNISSLTPAWMHWAVDWSKLWPPWPTWVSKGLAKQWPQIILQPLPPLLPSSAPAPPRQRGRPPLTLRQRPGDSSQTDGSEAIWRGRHAESGITVTALTPRKASHLQWKKKHTHTRTQVA